MTSSTLILMPYKQSCKIEGEIITKIKLARVYFKDRKKQKNIAKAFNCHKNTVLKIIKSCKENAPPLAMKFLKNGKHIAVKNLKLFEFLKSKSRKPKSNKRCLSQENEDFIVVKHKKTKFGFKRLHRHLTRQGHKFTLGEIKGVYKRRKLKSKKIRTVNKNRRKLYNYDEIEAFQHLQYDVKEIADQSALPQEIYQKFLKKLPKYQWTITDAKTKTRFLGWSYSLSSFFGYQYLEMVILWLRAHNVKTKINVQFDGGREFCRGSKRKLSIWNENLSKYDVEVFQTDGSKWKQNIVERSHRTDDEEFYCPRGEFMNTKSDFIIEGQYWIQYFNNRPHDGIGLNGISPREKLEQLGFYNASKISNFPMIILDDFFKTLLNNAKELEEMKEKFKKSQNVLTYYRILFLYH